MMMSTQYVEDEVIYPDALGCQGTIYENISCSVKYARA